MAQNDEGPFEVDLDVPDDFFGQGLPLEPFRHEIAARAASIAVAYHGADGNTVDQYICDKCGFEIMTVRTSPGIIPTKLRCLSEGGKKIVAGRIVNDPDCAGVMISQGYPDLMQDMVPNFKWYRPVKHSWHKYPKAVRIRLEAGALIIKALDPAVGRMVTVGDRDYKIMADGSRRAIDKPLDARAERRRDALYRLLRSE